MAELSLRAPGKVFFGSDVLNLAGTLAEVYGTRSILITHHALHEGRHIERVKGILRGRGIECIVVDDADALGKGRAEDMARASRVQVVLGMGGMRTLSLARKTACLLSPPTGHRPPGEPFPYIEIPTVFRNPFLLTDAYLDQDSEGRRPRIVPGPEGLLKAALVDPGLTATLPPRIAGAMFLDSILQSLEGYLAGDGNFLSDTLFARALKLLGEGVDDTVRGSRDQRPRDLRARVKASQAGILSALGLATCTSGAGSALCHSIGSLFDAPRALVGAVLLPHIMDLHLGARAEKLADAAKALGEDVFGLTTAEAAARAPARTRRIIAQLGLPGRLRDLDLKPAELVDAAEAASRFDAKDGLPMTVDSLYDILKRAY